MSWNQHIQNSIRALERSDYSACEKSLKAALEFARSNFSREDARLAMTLSLLGQVYFKAKNFRIAEPLLEQSIKLHGRQRVLNEPCVIMDSFVLAEIKKDKGESQQACQIYLEAINRIRGACPLEPAVIRSAAFQFENLLSITRTEVAGKIPGAVSGAFPKPSLSQPKPAYTAQAPAAAAPPMTAPPPNPAPAYSAPPPQTGYSSPPTAPYPDPTAYPAPEASGYPPPYDPAAMAMYQQYQAAYGGYYQQPPYGIEYGGYPQQVPNYLPQQPMPAPAPAPAPTPAPAPAQTQPSGGYKPSTLVELWQKQYDSGYEMLMAADDDNPEQYVSAYLNLESALRVARKQFTGDDLRKAKTMAALGAASARLRMYDQSEALYTIAIECAHNAEAASPYEIACIELESAAVFAEQEKYDVAEEMYVRIRQFLLDNGLSPSEDHRAYFEKMRERVKTLSQVRDLWEQAQDAENKCEFERAAKSYNNALSLLKQAFPPNHPEMARILLGKAQMLRVTGHDGGQAQELQLRAERIETAQKNIGERWSRLTAGLPRPEIDKVPV